MLFIEVISYFIKESFFSYENEVCVCKTQNNSILSTKRYCLDENNDGSIQVYKGDITKHRSLGESCHNLKEIANIIHDNIHGHLDAL